MKPFFLAILSFEPLTLYFFLFTDQPLSW